ncbi:SDR family oxidoreductase [Hymenobacter terricola]|uniref:SDR family oxidoreductase n=1 Tax=Hymenobacter terricola TaxID=2819236 RepID=UPI001B3027F4|nr:SDR family oxidoreductase [Hymenobacter terricola]
MLAITGATGHLGQATIQSLLLKVAPAEIVAVVRDLTKADGLRQQGVQVRHGDYNDFDSLVAAFQGVATVLLISTSEVEFAPRVQQHQNVIDAARQAGVPHLIYTSVLNPSRDSHFAASPSHAATEDYLRASGLAYTLFRDTLYLDLVPEFAGPDVLPSGKLYSAAGEGKVSYALRIEIAEALANVLTSTGHENQTYDIGPGPSYSARDIARTLSEVTGQPVEYVPITTDALAAGMRGQQVPEPFVNLMVGIVKAMEAGELESADPTFERLLGRKPTDLKTYLTTVYAK